MRSGTWSGPVSTDNVRVTVNGTVRPVDKVTIRSGMRDGHPASDQSSWCVESTIEWADPNAVAATAPHLFGGSPTEWVPKPGDTVVVETGDGALDKWWVQHRGVIDDTTGSIADGTAVSTTVDVVEELSARVNFGALAARMHPVNDADTSYREMGMQSTFLIDRMLRMVQNDTWGRYATPPRTWQTVGSAPCQGSLWPETGTLHYARNRDSAFSGPAWFKTPYGVGPTNYTAEYRLTSAVPEVILSTFVTATTGGSTGRIRVVNADGVGCFLGYDQASDQIEFGIVTTGTATYRVPRSGVTRAAVYFRRNTTSSQTLVLRLSDGREITQATSSTGFPNGWTGDRVFVDNATGLGWWMVEGEKVAAQRWATLEHVPTARIRVGAMPWWLCSRDLPYTDAAAWLQEQVDAECASAWFDEDNTFQWAGRDVLDGQAVAKTVTSVRDVDEIQWEQRRSALARSVWVNSLTPQLRQLLGGARMNAWQHDGFDLSRTESETVTCQVSDDEDWLGVDLSPVLLTQYTEPSWLRNGSKYGGTQYTELADGESGQTWTTFVDCTMTRKGLRAIDVYYSPWTSLPSNVRVRSKIPDLYADNAPSSRLQKWHANNAAVRIRARGIAAWTETERSLNAGGIGPSRYTHDAGWRVQSFGSIDAVGDLMSWLRTQVSQTTRPRVTGLTLEHDPRLQIGDLIRVQDTAITGIDFDMLIQERTVDVDSMTETITGRVTVVRLKTDNGPLVTDWTSRQEPGGSTPMTPPSDWTREKVV